MCERLGNGQKEKRGQATLSRAKFHSNLSSDRRACYFNFRTLELTLPSIIVE